MPFGSNFFSSISLLQETIIHANSFQYKSIIYQDHHTLSVSDMIQIGVVQSVSARLDILYRARNINTYQGTPRR